MDWRTEWVMTVGCTFDAATIYIYSMLRPNFQGSRHSLLETAGELWRRKKDRKIINVQLIFFVLLGRRSPEETRSRRKNLLKV